MKSSENFNPNQNPEDFNSASEWSQDVQNFEQQFARANENSAATAEKIAARERRENHIISDLNGKPNQITAAHREHVYDLFVRGQINARSKRVFLERVKTPFELNPDQATANFDAKHDLRILSYFEHGGNQGFDNPQPAEKSDLENFLRTYPIPSDFEAAEKSFLEKIQNSQSSKKYQQYLDAMTAFKEKIYGERFGYHEAIENLQAQAFKADEDQRARAAVMQTFRPSPLEDDTPRMPAEAYRPQPPIKFERERRDVNLRELSPAERERILKNARIDGDPFIYNGEEFMLTKENLQTCGLEPKYGFQLQNAQINLSDPYDIGKRTAITAYVETETGTKICSYYRSNSQGVWRLFPDYIPESNNSGKFIHHYGKGHDEESLNLPIETQFAIEQILTNHPKVELNRPTAFFAFAGTAKRIDSENEYIYQRDNHLLRGDHYAAVSATPKINHGKTTFDKVRPETLDIFGGDAPDFSHSENNYQTASNLYGDYTAQHFPSTNGALTWTFNQRPDGQVWIGGLEIAASPLSADGLHTEWARIGDYGTPLYEYQDLSDGYGDPNDRHDKYLNMWDGYLSHMPIIQKYRNHLAQSQSAPKKKGLFSFFKRKN